MNPIPRRSFGRPAPVALVGLLACTLAAVLAAGCGDRNLIVRADLLSFLTPEEKEAHYGPIPAGVSGSFEVVQSRRLNLLPGLDAVTTVTDVQVEVGAVLVNLTGTGTGRIAVHLSPAGTDPFVEDTTPVVGTFAVNGAMSDTIETVVVGDSDLEALFTSKEAQIGIRVVLNSGVGVDPLEGDLTLTTLRAVVTGKQAVIE